jgi:hypothetical protein
LRETTYIGLAEIMGLALVGYGVWFAIKGAGMLFWDRKDWWRPLDRRKRYPYPVAGVLLGVCFVLLGLRFALHFSWERASILGYIGGGLFVVVFAIGIGQPRFLHPRWYGLLEDRLGKKGMQRLRAAAFRLETEEWLEVDATEASFSEWVERALPQQRAQSRGFQKGKE